MLFGSFEEFDLNVDNKNIVASLDRVPIGVIYRCNVLLVTVNITQCMKERKKKDEGASPGSFQ